MLRSRRDYLIRIIEEVGEFLARAVFKRRAGREQEALQSVVQACERLFGLEAAQLFQFTPEQHFLMLTEGFDPPDARARVLLYAALNLEAGRNYAVFNKAELARASFVSALRFTLRAQQAFPDGEPPTYTPSVDELLELLKDAPLDPETARLLDGKSQIS
ncbi:MAG TPA: hypothetical protein VG838_15210 [Opitutaceae bacterium]|nr:hypothetical protein [Opitutaceae bacterium]